MTTESVTIHETNGAFTHDFAAKKRWKLDEKLLEAIQEVLPLRSSVIDLGAGIGRTVQALRDGGWEHVEGVDGIPGIFKLSKGLVIEMDLTGPHLWTRFYLAGWRPDAAICIECAEHVPASLQDQFWDNVADAMCIDGLLIVSVATPGQRGKDHVACQLPETVAARLGRRGHDLDEPLTQKARSIAGKGWNRKLIVTRRKV